MLDKDQKDLLKRYLRGEISVPLDFPKTSQVTQENINKWFSTKTGYYLERRLSASFLKQTHSWENPTFLDKVTSGDAKEKRFEDGKAFEDYVSGLNNVINENSSLRHLADKVKEIFSELQTTKQQTIFKGDIFGYKCKCKIDFESEDTIYELKSTSSKTLGAYASNHISFMYDMQAYIQNLLSGKDVVFLVASKANHNIWVYYPDYDLGQRQFMECVAILEQYELHTQFKV
jgi:PDDEXK-like domain of unknown function (DUF3799)